MTLESKSVENKEDSLEKRSDEKASKMSKSAQQTLKLSGAAIFGALSLIMSAYLTPILARIPGWQIAIFDPISLVWITCFLIFGVEAGLMSLVIGAFGLLPFDPTAWLGPMMKFSATFSLLIVPIIILKLYKREEGISNSKKLKDRKNFIICGILGTALRCVVMLILNIVVFLTIYAGYEVFVDLAFIGLPGITSWTAIVIGVILINAYQSALDLLIPYVIVYGALDYGLKLDEKFEIW